MSDPTIMSPHQYAEVKEQAARLRAMAAGLRIESMAPRSAHDDDVRDPMALAIAADLRAADLERTMAQSNAAERAKLDADLHLARTVTLNAHRHGSLADVERATDAERAAVMAVVEFNKRTIRMVPVTHVRR
jgi:hypothetical protein